jgi:23S rRNA (cytosine1962-C5)-methyltransferase
MIQTFTPNNWTEYELLDCGNFEKLERFGKLILRRPEPQALWNRVWPEIEWKKLSPITFKQKGSHNGDWVNPNKLPTKWQLPYEGGDYKLMFNLSLTSFKHVGIFPEQANNWDYIYDNLSKITEETPRFLNLFAYTGGASIAAKAAGADVTHVDSVKQVISWSRENMESSKLENIRWVVEDALKFVKREARRGNFYQGILLDPPAYGRGPDGEKWVLEEQIDDMLKSVKEILDPKEHILLTNVYSLGFSTLVVENLMNGLFDVPQNAEFGEIYLNDTFNKKLPLGVFHRYLYQGN